MRGEDEVESAPTSPPRPAVNLPWRAPVLTILALAEGTGGGMNVDIQETGDSYVPS